VALVEKVGYWKKKKQVVEWVQAPPFTNQAMGTLIQLHLDFNIMHKL
jgi:hypothetical protein